MMPCLLVCSAKLLYGALIDNARKLYKMTLDVNLDIQGREQRQRR